MPETGFSMVRTYRQCPKRYEYSYLRNLRAKRPMKPLFRGTILHEMLEARAIGTKDPRTVLKEYETEYAELLSEEQEYYGARFIADTRRVYEGYLREYANDGWKTEAAEEPIATDLTKSIRFVGHIDLRIITAKDGRRWLVDHKCVKEIPTEEERFSNYQLLLYVWAYNRERRDKVDGIIWNYLRTKPPTVPEQLKNGQLTQRANLDSDVHTYSNELARLNLPAKPYREYIEQLRARSIDKFYLRVPLPNPSKELTERVVEEFKQTSIIMHGLEVHPRNMTGTCAKTCEFYRLCQAELRGLDAKFIERTGYEERSVETEEEE